jgi:hypothetical protein
MCLMMFVATSLFPGNFRLSKVFLSWLIDEDVLGLTDVRGGGFGPGKNELKGLPLSRPAA